MEQLSASLRSGVPSAFTELTTLGRTLKQRAAEVPATSTGPAPAPVPRKRSTAGSSTCAASPFGKLTNYIARCLLETGGFGPRPHWIGISPIDH